MSRSDGQFPSYRKLKLDPEKPPGDFWQRGVRRCTKCEASWPNYSVFKICPRDGEKTMEMQHASTDVFGESVKAVPDMTWRQAAKELLLAEFDKLYEEWNEGKTDVELVWTDANIAPDQERELENFRKDIENAKLDTPDHS